ncbi:hypothetical protein PAPHI01_0370 [Pancytospora philotis]|nr:hypothetical protein PAPHI01_0344 [Pancytospora philotis]KAI4291096.1 hypothetical protein PAPHI01_0370 [Pancytospora philotis]
MIKGLLYNEMQLPYVLMLVVSYLLLLLLVRGATPITAHPVKNDAAKPPRRKLRDWNKSYSIDGLKTHVLEPICRYCMHYVAPEIPAADIDAKLLTMTVQDREICVVTAVLNIHDRLTLLGRLLTDLGYARQFLVAELLSLKYVASLEATLRKQSSDAYACALSLLLRSDEIQHLLRQANEMLIDRVEFVLYKTLSKYVKATHDRDDAFDYAIFTTAKYYTLKRTNDDEYRDLLKYWLADNPDSLCWIPFICEYLRIVLTPKFLPQRKQIIIKKDVVKFVATQDDKRYLKLLKAFENVNTIKIYVQKCVKKRSRHGVNPFFIANYSEFIRAASGSVHDNASAHFWAEYLEEPCTFIKTKSIWNEYPSFFNMIGHVWLRKFFYALADDKFAADLDQNTSMRKYMNMLDFETFFKVAQGVSPYHYTDMIIFMLRYLDENSRKAYLFRAKAIEGSYNNSSIIGIRLRQIILRLEKLSCLMHDENDAELQTPRSLQARRRPRGRKRAYSD